MNSFCLKMKVASVFEVNETFLAANLNIFPLFTSNKTAAKSLGIKVLNLQYFGEPLATGTKTVNFNPHLSRSGLQRRIHQRELLHPAIKKLNTVRKGCKKLEIDDC